MATSPTEKRFAAILERYGRLLRHAIAQRCPRESGLVVEDLEQEALLRLWQAIQGEKET